MPLGRLTYVVYLVHYEFLYFYWAHARKPYYYTVLDHIQHYFGVTLMIFLLAFLISVTVEAPFLNLEKLLFSPAQKSSQVIRMMQHIILKYFYNMASLKRSFFQSIKWLQRKKMWMIGKYLDLTPLDLSRT